MADRTKEYEVIAAPNNSNNLAGLYAANINKTATAPAGWPLPIQGTQGGAGP